MALLDLGLSVPSLNAFFNQSSIHQSGLWGSSVAPPNANLAAVALVLALLGLAIVGFSTYGWRYLNSSELD